MKKNHLLFSALALLSFNAFSQSTNYASKVLNDDGTSTIVTPKFNNANGSSFISSSSDANGLCRLYGFDFAYGNLMITSGDVSDKTAIINSDGKLSSWRSYSSSYNNSFVTAISCGKNGQILTASNRIAPIRNDDGTYSLVNPVVGRYHNGDISYVSSISNMNGVCSYFGLGRAIPNTTLTTGDVSGRTIIIGSLGKAEAYRSYSSSYNNSYVKSVTCEANVGQGPQTPELNETVELPRSES